MRELPPIVEVALAAGFGAFVAAGGLAALQIDALTTVMEPLGDGLLVIWLGGFLLGVAHMGARWEFEAISLVGGATLGTLLGFLVAAAVIGWSFVLFPVAFLAILAIAVGGWIGVTLADRPPATKDRAAILLVGLVAAMLVLVLLVA